MFKKKKLKKKKTKPGTLLQPVKPITKQKHLAIVRPISQIILWMPKNILTVKQHSQKPETCHFEKIGSYLATKD